MITDTQQGMVKGKDEFFSYNFFFLSKVFSSCVVSYSSISCSLFGRPSCRYPSMFLVEEVRPGMVIKKKMAFACLSKP